MQREGMDARSCPAKARLRRVVTGVRPSRRITVRLRPAKTQSKTQMTTMISELYEALVDAGATEQKAKEAAEALSAENLATKKDIDEVRGHIHKLELNMAVLKWMVGATLTGVAAIIVKIFFVA